MTQPQTQPPTRFNEAAGIHRRKRRRGLAVHAGEYLGFNEAAGIHRRKLPWGP